MDHLTLMGHGFGATTAITMGAKDDRIKKIISYDAWLTPLKEEISTHQIKLIKPHCSINSELFQANLPENWELLTKVMQVKQKS